MKKLIFTLILMLVTSFVFADNVEKTILEENVVTLNEISKTELQEKILEINNSLEDIVSLKCWAAKQWIKHQLSKISAQDELIDEIGDAVYEICEKLREFDLID
jgi:hypothetical protein